MDLNWQEIGFDSENIDRIAHDGATMYVEFKKGSGYSYPNLPFDIFERIMSKEVISKSEGKSSYGATFHSLVIKGGYKGEQYK